MGETYRARSRRSSFSRICTVMAMLQDREAVSRHPRHSAAYRGSPVWAPPPGTFLGVLRPPALPCLGRC